MAITGQKKEGNGGNYQKTYGISGYEILGVNVNNKELSELGFYVKDEDLEKEREFTGEREGAATVRIEFVAKSLGQDGKLRRFTFWLENNNARNKEGGAKGDLFKFINDQGEVSWSRKPTVFEPLNPQYAHYFTGVDDAYNPRPAKKGEEEFMLFMRNCMAIDFRNGGTIKYNIKKIFNGNMSEIAADLKTEFLTPMVVATTIEVKTTDEGIKEVESFYRYAFAPAAAWKELQKKGVFTDDDIHRIHTTIQENKLKSGRSRTYVTPLEKMIAKMTDAEYPCKDVYHLGFVKNYISEQNVESSEQTIIHDEEETTYDTDNLY
jgi:hypothetical protein